MVYEPETLLGFISSLRVGQVTYGPSGASGTSGTTGTVGATGNDWNEWNRRMSAPIRRHTHTHTLSLSFSLSLSLSPLSLSIYIYMRCCYGQTSNEDPIYRMCFYNDELKGLNPFHGKYVSHDATPKRLLTPVQSRIGLGVRV